jgi:hypothetical protein
MKSRLSTRQKVVVVIVGLLLGAWVYFNSPVFW